MAFRFCTNVQDHFGFYENGKLVGYCVLNGEGYLLQFFLAINRQRE
ncbi:hypothetical protein O9992_23320 [Vibrio lentus]|nr:hypothetical protein [Vibrio lentus]